MGLFWAYQWLSPEGSNIYGRLFGLIEALFIPQPTLPAMFMLPPTTASEDLAANASLNSAKPVSGLAEVLAIAGEEPDAVREGVRVASRRHRRDTISGTGRILPQRLSGSRSQG
jgi:hypothetical protein